ncbi:ribonuclease T2 family protein [Pseudomonas nicosulfuronedens]
MTRICTATGLLAALLLAPFITAHAAEATQGSFEVSSRCEAYQSFKNGTNPDSRFVQPGETYRVLEVNKEPYQWVRVQLPGSGMNLRWVSAACGKVTQLQIGNRDAAQCKIADTYDSYVLALTWQPGFCEHNPAGGEKPECQAMKDGRLTVSHFTLHGLWPNKTACGKRYGNCSGAALELSSATLDYIKPWMPNFQFSTQFGNYEWKKHGVCQSRLSDDDYFRLAVDLTKSFDDSAPGTYVREHVGGTISKREFYSKLGDELGSTEAANNVLLICSGGYLEEIRIALPQDFKGARSVREIIDGHFAPRRSEDRKECRSDAISIETAGYSRG